MVGLAGGKHSRKSRGAQPLKDFVRTQRIRLDLAKAADFYEEESASLSMRFLTAFGQAVRLARMHSAIGSLRHDSPDEKSGTRFVITDGFPYLLFYKDEGKRIVLLRLLHMSRNIAAAFHRR